MFGGDRKAQFRKQCEKDLNGFLIAQQRIVLPTSSSPQVSILIVLYNAAELSFRLFRSLADTIDIPCEVIVIDNASGDRTQDLCARIDGARIVRNAENLHFLRAANQAAALAQGSALLFLNSDVELDRRAIRNAWPS